MARAKASRNLEQNKHIIHKHLTTELPLALASIS